jgi:hypothetical protein
MEYMEHDGLGVRWAQIWHTEFVIYKTPKKETKWASTKTNQLKLYRKISFRKKLGSNRVSWMIEARLPLRSGWDVRSDTCNLLFKVLGCEEK